MIQETWPPSRGYPAEVLDVHDGDTFTARLDLGFFSAQTIKVRLAGVNAPELKAPGGIEAAQYLDDLLAQNEESVRVFSHRHEQSFARWVCDVSVGFEPRDVATIMVEAGHAERE